jgi:hypothetical protein
MYSFHLTMKIDAIHSSESSVNAFQITRRHIPQDGVVRSHHCLKLKFDWLKIIWANVSGTFSLLWQKIILRETKIETTILSWLMARIGIFSLVLCVVFWCCDGSCLEWADPLSKGLLSFVLNILYHSKSRFISFMQKIIIRWREIQLLDISNLCFRILKMSIHITGRVMLCSPKEIRQISRSNADGNRKRKRNLTLTLC